MMLKINTICWLPLRSTTDKASTRLDLVLINSSEGHYLVVIDSCGGHSLRNRKGKGYLCDGKVATKLGL